MNNNYIWLVILILCKSAFADTFYSKPQIPKFSVGDTLVESVTQKYESQTIKSTETSVLNKIETFSGNNYNHWITTTNIFEPTESTTTTRRFADDMGVFVAMSADSDDNNGLAVYKTMQNDLGEKFKVGDIILDSTAFFNTTILHEGVTSSGYGLTAIKGTLNGIQNITTNIGEIECYSIDFFTETVIRFGNAQNSRFDYVKSEQGTIWQSNSLGRVKSSVQISEEINDDGYTQSTTYFEDRILISAPDIKTAIAIDKFSTSKELLQNNMGGWMWMGSLPWVYNASTENWAYLANQELYVWDASEAKWLFFDQRNKTWDYAQP